MDRKRKEGHMAQDTDVALTPDSAGVRGARFRLPARRTRILRADEVAPGGGGGVAAARRPDASDRHRRAGDTPVVGEDARRA